MATPAELAQAAADSLRQESESQEKLNEAAQDWLSQFGPVAPQALKRLSSEMRSLDKESGTSAKKLLEVSHTTKDALVSLVAGATASAGLTKFAHSANPQIVQAFGTQMELLSAKLGNQLMPAFTKLMDAADEAADIFDGWSDGTKTLVAAGVVAVPAIIAVGHAVAALAPAAALAWASVKRFYAMMQASPSLTAGLGVAGVAGAGYAITQGMKADEEKRDEEKGKSGRVTAHDFKDAHDNNFFARHTSHYRSYDELERMSEAERKHYYRQQSTHYREVAEKQKGSWFSNRGDIAENERRASVYARAAEHGADLPSEDAWRKQVGRAHNQLAAASREQAPHYSGLADVHKQIQLSMSKNAYEQKLLQEQRKSRESLVKKLDELIQQGKKKGYNIMA